MKAYLDFKPCHGFNRVAIVTEQDFFEGGPWAKSYESPPYATMDQAEADAREEAARQCLTLVGVEVLTS